MSTWDKFLFARSISLCRLPIAGTGKVCMALGIDVALPEIFMITHHAGKILKKVNEHQIKIIIIVDGPDPLR